MAMMMKGGKGGKGGQGQGGPSGNAGGVKRTGPKKGNPDNPNLLKGDPEATIWVGGLSPGATPEEIQDSFSGAGTVVHFKMNGVTKEASKGFKRAKVETSNVGFKSAKVQYSLKEEAEIAITMFNGCEVDGIPIVVTPWVKSKE